LNTHNETYPNVPGTAPEKRQHQRSRSDFLRLTFLGVEHVALNWSEGGALIPDRHPNLEVGAAIVGIAVIGPASHRFRFSAEVVRREAQQIALRFVNLSPALQRALSANAE
jgi:hypothetical protein